MSLLKKKIQTFMTEEERDLLRKNIQSRKEELELRMEQREVESEFKKTRGYNFNPEKLKKGAIIIVAGLAITFVIIKIISKFV